MLLGRGIALVGCLALAGCRGDAGGERSAGPPPTTRVALSTTTSSTAGTVTTLETTTTTMTAEAPEVVLAADGLGVVSFGDPAAVVVSRLTEALGPPVDDQVLGSCPTGDADRLVQFAELGVVFAGTGAEQRLVAWDVGLASGAIPELRTAEGIGVGSTVADLRAAYRGRLDVVPDDAFGPRFEVRQPSGVLTGTLTGTTDGDTIVTMGAGEASCGG
ncbi:MAG: hypothetical protein M3N15_02140 [Actinomycetota bacterium]|nr:hypothetical protein [Actinomycetota bacterium]